MLCSLKKKFHIFFKKNVFKSLALWADAFYKLKCLSVCPSVRVFTFEVPFKSLFALTSWSWMSNIFRVLESLGKSNEEKWSQIKTFLFEKCLKLPRKKSFFSFSDFALHGGNHAISRSFWAFAFLVIFFVKKKMGFWVFLVHPPMALVLLSALVGRCCVSHMLDF